MRLAMLPSIIVCVCACVGVRVRNPIWRPFTVLDVVCTLGESLIADGTVVVEQQVNYIRSVFVWLLYF